MKKRHIIWGIVFFIYLLLVFGLKSGFILKGWITFSTMPASVTFRSYIDIAILVLLSYLSLMLFISQKMKKKYLMAISSFCFFICFFFLSGQVIVRDLDNVGESFLLFGIKDEKYIDRELLEFNYGGYDESAHCKSSA